jgi:hypothetical protein
MGNGREGGSAGARGTRPDARPARRLRDARVRDETCPVSTGGGTRRVQLVREGGGGREVGGDLVPGDHGAWGARVARERER